MIWLWFGIPCEGIALSEGNAWKNPWGFRNFPMIGDSPGKYVYVPRDKRTWRCQGWKAIKNLKTNQTKKQTWSWFSAISDPLLQSDRIVRRTKMGNTAARQRLKAQDFAYISRNTAFLSRDVSSKPFQHKIDKSSLMVNLWRLCPIITPSWCRGALMAKWNQRWLRWQW